MRRINFRCTSDNSTYLSAMLGAASLMLLRICDKASPFSAGLAIIGMTALVYSLCHARSKTEYISIAVMMAVTFTVRCYGYTGDPASDLAVGLLVGMIMFGLMGVECFFRKLRDSFLYTLIFPAGYIVFMYFTEIIKINMPFRMDTYFSCFPVLCQITALFGIYSLDFLLAWTASSIVFFLDVGKTPFPDDGRMPFPDDGRTSFPDHGKTPFLDRGKSRQGLILAAVYIAAVSGVIGFGIVNWNQMNAIEAAKTDKVRVACAAGPYIGTLSDDSYTELTMEETLASLTGIVEEAAAQKAEILVLSEEAYGVSDLEEETLLAEAEKLALAYDLHLLLAYEVADTDNSQGGKGINKLCWISNEGEILYDYTKHCIIPLIETSDYVRGDKQIESFSVKVHGKTLNVATAICYDADFDLFMSHMGKNVDLLLLPTWDWKVIAEEHFSVARLRAIQSGTTLVRSVYDGWSAVIDSAGNVLIRENTNEIGYENVFVQDVPVR